MTPAESYKARIRASVEAWNQAKADGKDRPRRKPPRDLVPNEHGEQVRLCQWLDEHQLTYVAIPNAGRRSYAAAAKLRSEGMQKGYPDLEVKDQVPGHPGARGVAIEMKKRSGGTLSVDQHNWLRRLERCGYLTHVAEGAGDAISYLESLGFGGGR